MKLEELESSLLPCPFCGQKASIKRSPPSEECKFIIVGCSVVSMLCPNPSIVIYYKNDGYDPEWWNRRAAIKIPMEAEP
jgi:hypothetical protein